MQTPSQDVVNVMRAWAANGNDPRTLKEMCWTPEWDGYLVDVWGADGLKVRLSPYVLDCIKGAQWLK